MTHDLASPARRDPVTVHARARSFEVTAEAYERARPGYPGAALDAVAERLGLTRSSAVLDLAAGTGKLTRALVQRFAAVTAVEPLDGMRALLSRAVPAARALPGTAEAIPLEDGAVDAVFVAEAFHWFDARRAAAEIERVLRPGGGVAVLHNRGDREAGDEPWQRECRDVFEARRAPDDDVDPHDTAPWRAALSERFDGLDDRTIAHVQRLDADDLVALFSSFSVFASLPEADRNAALAEIRGVLERHGIRETEIPYRTEIVTARRR